jgi:bacterial/archaeal transporter family protein
LPASRSPSPFQAFSLGPANVVVPIYGMLIIGGALLGVVALDEPIDLAKSR